MSIRLVIFSDLDATLLDHRTYSYRAALPALKKVKKRGIPVVLCTSKTRAETEAVAGRLGLQHPFIVENGGAIFIPEDYFPESIYRSAGLRTFKKDNYRVIQFGTPYRRLRLALKMMARKIARKLIGFGDLGAREIAAVTGLGRKEAELASRREYDEPFFLENSPEFVLVQGPGQQSKRKDKEIKEIEVIHKAQGREITHGQRLGIEGSGERGKLFRNMQKVARSQGLRITAGGRFFHLTGNNDKGRAVRVLKKLYRLNLGKIITIGLGDSENDWPMLRAVDLPVLVARPDGFNLTLPEAGAKLLRTSRSGPEGWAEAVDFLLILHESANRETRNRPTRKTKGGNHG